MNQTELAPPETKPSRSPARSSINPKRIDQQIGSQQLELHRTVLQR